METRHDDFSSKEQDSYPPFNYARFFLRKRLLADLGVVDLPLTCLCREMHEY